MAAEAEEQKTRLKTITEEQTQYIEELQMRMEEEEEKVSLAKKEKAKLQEHLKDVEEQWVTLFDWSLRLIFYVHDC